MTHTTKSANNSTGIIRSHSCSIDIRKLETLVREMKLSLANHHLSPVKMSEASYSALKEELLFLESGSRSEDKNIKIFGEIIQM
jgi:hypothetical protein